MKKSINYFLATAMALSCAVVVSCDDDEAALPPIDGYNNSDEVAASNLVAMWGLNGNAEESISGEVGTGSNVTYGEGKVGQCAVFTQGYIYNDAIPNLHTKITSSVSISLWAQVRNNGKTPNEHATALAMLTGDVHTTPNNVTPGAILLETAHFRATSDTFRIKSVIGVTKSSGAHETDDNVNWWGLDNISTPGQMVKIAEGDWAHFVLVWDNTNKTLQMYVNKQVATNPEWKTKTGANFKVQQSMGMIIGGFNNNVGLTDVNETWAKAMTGKVDQVRVYNTVLSEAEIAALYNLEDVGR
jgi:hypothetical protein